MRSVILGLILGILGFATTGPAWAQAAAKARLQIDKLPAGTLDLAVFDAAASSFDRPLVFVHGVSAAGVEIPPGDLLVALRLGQSAPDLHHLKAKPGAPVHVEYRPSEGWSLFVRVRSLQTSKPVAGAVVSLGPSRHDTTGEDGLALFSGISGPVEAAVRHPDFVPQTMTGITSVLGGLTFRDFSLDAGARVRARVRLKGQPREKDFCRFQLLQEPPPESVEARTDAQGICQPGQHFAPGAYVISALLRGTTVPLTHAVTLVEGQDLLEDFAFADVRVHGKVTKGGRPAPDLTVRFQQGAPEEDTTGWDRVEGAAKTGADGTYTLYLPKPGSYTVGLLPRPQSPAPGLERTVVLKADQDKALDFTLQKIVIEGRIIDARQYPIEGAWVRLDWNDGTDYTVRTGKQGEFTFYLQTLGQGLLTAGKEGYVDAPEQEYDLDEEDDDIVPMVLTLNPPGVDEGESPPPSVL
jgi:hypothetical protein